MKADSWILNELPELLVTDWYNGLIYTESDMQACVRVHRIFPQKMAYSNNQYRQPQ